MASKGQKFKKVSPEIKKEILKKYFDGCASPKMLEAEYGISFEIEKDVHGLIIHSDQGFQYTSHQYKAVCSSKGVLISMSRKGTPIDDSPIESWHGILKKETLYNNDITSLEHYIQLVIEWIEFYNTTRIKNRNL